MSLDRFFNKLQVIQSKSREVGQTFKPEDLDTISYDSAVLDYIDENLLNVEAHFYNVKGDYLTSLYNVPYKYSSAYKDFLFDVPYLFNTASYYSGTYKIGFNFLINLIGDAGNLPFFLHEISSDRTELKLRVKLSYVSTYPSVVLELEEFRDVAAKLRADRRLNDININFGSNNLFSIVNLKVECSDTGAVQPCQQEGESNCNELVLYVKLKYPLPVYIQEKQLCFISYKVLEEYIDTFTVQPEEVLTPEGLNPLKNKVLKGPNFKNCTAVDTSNSTDLKSWNNLLDADITTTNHLIREILSGSEEIPLNIDYTSFSNFVVYGSATERLKNYNFKRQLVEYYDSQSNIALNSNAYASVYITKLTDNYLNRANTVLTEFDPFEKYLHYQSGSIFSYDITGSVLPAPKFVSGSRIINYPTTSSQYTAWYDSMLDIASAHDFRNYDSLFYNTPDHILRDPNNSEYVTFLYMIGQHFDNIYTYVRKLTSIHERDEHPERGIPNKLLPYYARSLGWKIQNTRQLSDLWLYKLGVNRNGQLLTPTGDLISQAHERLNHQIWKRVVNNLPYLLKTKGTERSVRALFSIYGIPFTLISVKEYGGPQTADTVQDETPNIAQQRFHYSLNFKGDQYIEFPRRLTSSSLFPQSRVPQTVEFRFNTSYTGSTSMSLWAIEESGNRANALHNLELVHYTSSLYGVNTYGYLKYTVATGSAGNLHYKTVTGSLLPYFDKDAWTVRIYSPTPLYPGAGFNGILTVDSGKSSEFVDSRVSLSSSLSINGTTANSLLYGLGADNSLNATGHYVLLGGTTGSFSARFSGSMQGYKEYFSSFSKTVFDEHILNPGSYHTDTYTGSFNELYRYFPLGLDNLKHDHDTYVQVSSSQPNRNYSADTTGSFFNFTGTDRTQYTPNTETYYQYIPTIGANVPKSNKVRIETSTLNGTLAPDKKVEESKYDRSQRDSNRLVIAFSPTDQVNRDIANQFGPYNFESFIGDPGDGLKDYYPDLAKARAEYFKKFTAANDIGKYIEIFSLYDYTVFSQLKQLIPARANLISGVLIEPSLLERSKVKRTLPSVSILGLDAQLPTNITSLSSSYIPPYQAELPLLPDIEISREKHTATVLTPIEVEVVRDKHTVHVHVSASLFAEREKYTADISVKERAPRLTSSTPVSTMQGMPSYGYYGMLLPSVFKAKTSAVQTMLRSGQVKDEQITYTYKRNGVIKTVSRIDRVYESLSDSIEVTNIEVNAKSIGSFTVKLNDSGSSLVYQPSFLTSNSYIFNITDYNLNIEDVKITGPEFNTFIREYNYVVKPGRNSIYLNTAPYGQNITYVSSSRLTPQYKRTVPYYSSSGAFTPGETSPLMLLSPVYLLNRTGSKTRYEQEYDFAVNKSIGAYYSSSEVSANYQHFEDSSIASCRFKGSRLVGPDVNINSTATAKGTPVVIVTLVEDNPIRTL